MCPAETRTQVVRCEIFPIATADVGEVDVLDLLHFVPRKSVLVRVAGRSFVERGELRLFYVNERARRANLGTAAVDVPEHQYRARGV